MMPIPSPSSSSSSSSSSPTVAKRTDIITDDNDTTWGPYAGVRDFKGNALVILSVLFCVILLFLAFNSIIRFLLCSSYHHDNPNSTSSTSHDDEEDPDQDKNQKNATDTGTADPPVVAFSKEMELAGAAAECAICLCEFEEGEGIRVLPACNHGFHVRCVERWLAVRGSCPTCRSSTINAATFAVKVADDD